MIGGQNVPFYITKDGDNVTDGKKFYWLKLKDDFFAQKEIKKLRRVAGGDTYTIIYLKLQLLSIKNDGKLIFDGVENNFIEEMSLELDEEPENVNVTLMFLQKHKLIEYLGDDEYLLPKVCETIGSETSSAERVRRHREGKKALQCNTDVTKCNTEIEIRDRDKRKEIEGKVRYAEYVTMKETEYQKLFDKYGEANTLRMIEILDNYKGSKGKTYKDDYRAILSWVVEKINTSVSTSSPLPQNSGKKVITLESQLEEMGITMEQWEKQNGGS